MNIQGPITTEVQSSSYTLTKATKPPNEDISAHHPSLSHKLQVYTCVYHHIPQLHSKVLTSLGQRSAWPLIRVPSVQPSSETASVFGQTLSDSPERQRGPPTVDSG